MIDRYFGGTKNMTKRLEPPLHAAHYDSTRDKVKRTQPTGNPGNFLKALSNACKGAKKLVN
jgi:hypothetical protein